MAIVRVYISGPITKGDRNHNYYQAVQAERDLMRAGFAPLNPMKTMVLPFAWDGEFPHAKWLQRDCAWVQVSDAVLRLPGESDGADQECACAEIHGVPVFHSIAAILEANKQRSFT